jgi:glucose-1-phosphate cytidylyltransferase
LKTVILAGGLGTRLAEETEIKPKPMVEIGDRPILWHILKHYAHFGHNEFYVALGYKGEYIKRYFVDYCALQGNMTVRTNEGIVNSHEREMENWTIHLIDTGHLTMTGGRLLRLRQHLSDGPFMLTYGDGLANVDISKLLEFHKRHGKIATVTAVRPPARFGRLEFDGDLVADFIEKPRQGEGWINGGFMVLEPAVFDYLDDDNTIFESNTLERLTAERQVAAFKHDDFWQCMDTLRDKKYLEEVWQSGQAPWRHL